MYVYLYLILHLLCKIFSDKFEVIWIKKGKSLTVRLHPANIPSGTISSKLSFTSRWLPAGVDNSDQDLENNSFFVRTRKLGGLYRSNTVGRMGFFMHH